jgi:hypothetical protein
LNLLEWVGDEYAASAGALAGRRTKVTIANGSHNKSKDRNFRIKMLLENIG